MKEMYQGKGKETLTIKLTDQQKGEIENLEKKATPHATLLVKYGTITFDYNGNTISMEGLRISVLNPWRLVLRDVLPKLDPHLLGENKSIIPFDFHKKNWQ